ncbi:MAG TPA: hypothetical protein VG826_24640 [Pirellulales bacterium]|nr:hypothetical protein [Pirellulales bacterium]
MRVECVHYGKQYSLQDENAGAHFKCRRCGKMSPVAALSAAAIEGTATGDAQVSWYFLTQTIWTGFTAVAHLA